MKKILFLLFFTLFLAACDKSTLSLSEVTNVPVDIQDKMEVDYRLQLINDGKDLYTSYIVYRTAEKVTTDLEMQGDTVKIKLDETNLQDGAAEPHVYKLTLDPEHGVIEVLVNGQSTPFDNITGGLMTGKYSE